jgi:hypothetical protein
VNTLEIYLYFNVVFQHPVASLSSFLVRKSSLTYNAVL